MEELFTNISEARKAEIKIAQEKYINSTDTKMFEFLKSLNKEELLYSRILFEEYLINLRKNSNT